MDTITHGIAGALMSKAAFGGRDLFSPRSLSKQRVITWSLMLGAIFPDSDVLRDFFSNNDLLMLTWHRSITHSLICLPVWAVTLAGLTHVVAKRRNGQQPTTRWDAARSQLPSTSRKTPRVRSSTSWSGTPTS